MYNEGTLQLDYKSCEMIADDMYKEIKQKYPKRDVRIEVSEDGENGCEIYYPKSDSTKTDYKTYGEMVEGQDNHATH